LARSRTAGVINRQMIVAARRRADRITMLFAAVLESASGPKRTSRVAPHMSAFGGKADIDLASRLPLTKIFEGPLRFISIG
jgi:hypothetical protein